MRLTINGVDIIEKLGEALKWTQKIISENPGLQWALCIVALSLAGSIFGRVLGKTFQIIAGVIAFAALAFVILHVTGSLHILDIVWG
jgi:hypothetical protein